MSCHPDMEKADPEGRIFSYQVPSRGWDAKQPCQATRDDGDLKVVMRSEEGTVRILAMGRVFAELLAVNQSPEYGVAVENIASA